MILVKIRAVIQSNFLNIFFKINRQKNQRKFKLEPGSTAFFSIFGIFRYLSKKYRPTPPSGLYFK